MYIEIVSRVLTTSIYRAQFSIIGKTGTCLKSDSQFKYGIYNSLKCKV